MTAAATYTYQVAAVVTGGEATRSTRVSVTVPGTIISPPPPPPSPPQPPGGGGAPRTSAPGAPRNLTAAGGDGEVVLSWDAPESDGGAEITDYEYRINGRNPWISIGSTNTTHTVTGLVNGTEYTFQVRAVNRVGKSRLPNQAEATPEAPGSVYPGLRAFRQRDRHHLRDGARERGPHPIRPAIPVFLRHRGALVSPDSVVDVTGDMAITEDGALTVQMEMEPLGVLTISTHGQGELVSGSATVVSDGVIGGFVRYSVPGVGVAGVGPSPPVSDALFPARRQEGESARRRRCTTWEPKRWG